MTKPTRTSRQIAPLMLALCTTLAMTACTGALQVGALDSSQPQELAPEAQQALSSLKLSEQVKVIVVPHTEVMLLQKPDSEAKLRNKGHLGNPDEEAEGTDESRESDTLLIGVAANGEARSFLKFDLETIPRDAEILGAKLVLTTAVNGQGVLEVACGAAHSAWTPDTLTWDNQALIDEDTLQTVPSDKPNKQDTFEIIELVQSWHNRERPNHGLILKGLPSDPVAFRSYHTVKSGNLINGPRLELIYRVAP